jgi:ribonuclease H / adenosylcobalamin/alpha-ribazole phosphatase
LQKKSERKTDATVLVITRHPVTKYNEERLVQGSGSDTPIDEEGRRQAQMLAKKLISDYRIGTVYCSPLLRCRQGIEPFLKETDVPVHYVDALKERSYGEFEGKSADSYTKWKADNGFLDNFDFLPPGGESFRDVMKRVRGIKDQILRKEQGKTILVCGHNVTDIALLLSLFGQTPEDHYKDYKFSNASITVVEIDSQGKPSLKVLNSTAHLRS